MIHERRRRVVPNTRCVRIEEGWHQWRRTLIGDRGIRDPQSRPIVRSDRRNHVSLRPSSFLDHFIWVGSPRRWDTKELRFQEFLGKNPHNQSFLLGFGKVRSCFRLFIEINRSVFHLFSKTVELLLLMVRRMNVTREVWIRMDCGGA